MLVFCYLVAMTTKNNVLLGSFNLIWFCLYDTFKLCVTWNDVSYTVVWRLLTFALEALPEEAVEQAAAVVTKRRRHERVHLEPVRYVYLEPLSQVLQQTELASLARHSCGKRVAGSGQRSMYRVEVRLLTSPCLMLAYLGAS